MASAANQAQSVESADGMIASYFRLMSKEYRLLEDIRQKVSECSQAALYFEQQRLDADAPYHTSSNPARKIGAEGFYNLMKRIGKELHDETGAFDLWAIASDYSAVLDMCMAPGGLLQTALDYNETAQAVAFTLPPTRGGLEVFLPANEMVMTKYLDITMLAGDMAIGVTPAEQGAPQYLTERQLPKDYFFDLVLCDGHVLRTQPRPAARESREARRLIAVQLALGLEHLKPGGTMVVLLHKLDKMHTAEKVWRFSQFSKVELFKPTCGHNMRSSFYLVASEICTHQREVTMAIRTWKRGWKHATFGTDEEYAEVVHRDVGHARELLQSFGEDLVGMGAELWKIQAEALANAPFMVGSD